MRVSTARRAAAACRNHAGVVSRGAALRWHGTSMRAVVVPQAGPGPASGALRVVPAAQMPHVGPHDVRVKVAATAVCHRDVLDRTGAFPFIKPDAILGHEIAGVVDQVGELVDNDTLAVGTRVVSLHWAPCGHCRACMDGRTTHCANARDSFFGLSTDGGYAEYTANRASAFVPVPDGWAAHEAAPVMCTYGTVWQGALTRGRLQAGETVLITGASGGVGSAAVQIASALGCRVLAVTSDPGKEAYLSALGASDVIMTGGEGAVPIHKHPVVRNAGGVDMAFEAVGEPTFGSALRSLRIGGRMVLIGNVTNAAAKLPLGLVIIHSLEIIGSDSVTPNELATCFEFLDRKGIRPVVSDVLPLEDAAVAHEMLESRQVSGRVVLSVGGEW